MARGPRTSLLTMLPGGISRLKTTTYTGFIKNHLGPLRAYHTGPQEAAR